MNAEFAPQPIREVAPPLLGRQIVRRTLVTLLGMACILLAEQPAVRALLGSDWERLAMLVLIVLLIALNVVLRRTTRHLAYFRKHCSTNARNRCATTPIASRIGWWGSPLGSRCGFSSFGVAIPRRAPTGS